MVSNKTRIYYLCEDVIEKYDRLRDTKRQSEGRIFLF